MNVILCLHVFCQLFLAKDFWFFVRKFKKKKRVWGWLSKKEEEKEQEKKGRKTERHW